MTGFRHLHHIEALDFLHDHVEKYFVYSDTHLSKTLCNIFLERYFLDFTFDSYDVSFPFH